MAVVVFDPAQFKIAFPEFASVPDLRLTVLFGMAEGVLDNTDASIVVNITTRTSLFYLIVAHLLVLFGTTVTGTPGSGPSGVVGRTSSATEGSVSASFEFRVADTTSEAWWVQTQYGAMYWMLTAQFRSFRYVAIGQSGAGHAIDFRNRRRNTLPDDNSGTPGGM